MKNIIKGKLSYFKLIAFAVLALLAVIIIISIIIKDDTGEDEFFAPVITIKPIHGSLEKTLRITSQVETVRLVTMVPRVGGLLMALSVKAGDEVNEGQVLAQVDSSPYQLTYLQAQSAFMTARATFERISQVYQNQGVSRQSYDEARMAFEVARAQFELAQLNVDYARIRAPMKATVLMIHGTEGSLVGTGSPLVTLGDLASLKIKAAIPEINYKFFAENWETMSVRLMVPALGNEVSFDLVPYSLAPYVSPENRSFLVEYEIPNGAEHGLRPGMFVNVIFTLEKREDVYYLPFRALASQNRLWYATEDNISQYMEMTSEFFNNDFFQIPSEFKDRVFILEGQHFITAGQKLNILSEVSE